MEQNTYILIYILSWTLISLTVCIYRGLYRDDGYYAPVVYIIVTLLGWIMLPILPILGVIQGVCFFIRRIELFFKKPIMSKIKSKKVKGYLREKKIGTTILLYNAEQAVIIAENDADERAMKAFEQWVKLRYNKIDKYVNEFKPLLNGGHDDE